MLLQTKAFLQYQVRKFKVEGNASVKPFSIVVLGYRECFKSLDVVLWKLQRDISWLHSDAAVYFLDLDVSLPGRFPEQSIVDGIGMVLESVETKAGRVSSLSAILDQCSSPSADHASKDNAGTGTELSLPCILPPLSTRRPKVRIALSLDFDALSAFLGTGDHPDNNLSDYSTGIFAGRIGARRLLRMLQKYQLADRVTWFVPGHTMETFESTVREVVQSGAEIGLHGYAHEGAYQMTPEQERDVLVKCMDIAQRLTGKRVQGYRAPLYQLRETTIAVLKEFGFLYDTSLAHHDCQPYLTPSDRPIERIDFSKPASSWLHPTPLAPMNAKSVGAPLVEIPTGWNNEDMMALQYFPHLHNSHGHVDVRVVEQRWKDMFLWLWENGEVDEKDGSLVFPILMHPDTSGTLHVISMVDRFVGWLRSWGDSVEFWTHGEVARDWLEKHHQG